MPRGWVRSTTINYCLYQILQLTARVILGYLEGVSDGGNIRVNFLDLDRRRGTGELGLGLLVYDGGLQFHLKIPYFIISFPQHSLFHRHVG